MSITVLVFGGRHYSDRDSMYAALDVIHSTQVISKIIHGGASGADSLAEDWAHYRGITFWVEPANWLKYGPSAGPRRNSVMAAMQPDLGLEAPGGRGTADMRGKLIARGIKVATVEQVLAWAKVKA